MTTIYYNHSLFFFSLFFGHYNYNQLCVLCVQMPSDPAQQAAVRSIWQKADAVCFDVDSTVCKDEGLDELAEYCGVGQQVKEWWVGTKGLYVMFAPYSYKLIMIIQYTVTEF